MKWNYTSGNTYNSKIKYRSETGESSPLYTIVKDENNKWNTVDNESGEVLTVTTSLYAAKEAAQEAYDAL